MAVLARPKDSAYVFLTDGKSSMSKRTSPENKAMVEKNAKKLTLIIEKTDEEARELSNRERE